jgi:hypothetical protein
VRREEIQDADDLQVRRHHGLLLTPDFLAYVLSAYGPVDVDAFAAPHNAVCPRFFALFDSNAVEAVDAFGQDWSRDAMFVLPDFHRIDAILDHIERDNAVVVLIMPHRACGEAKNDGIGCGPARGASAEDYLNTSPEACSTPTTSTASSASVSTRSS